MPVTETSRIANRNNSNTEYYNNTEGEVLFLFERIGDKGLTNAELIRDYETFIRPTLPTNIDQVISLSKEHQCLKGRRNNLMKKGFIELKGKRHCETNENLVEYYVYIGKELPKVEQLKNELKNREEDLIQINLKIKELKNEIAILEENEF